MMEDELRLRYASAGQGHVFEYWDELSSSEQDGLLQQLQSIAVEELEILLRSVWQQQQQHQGPINSPIEPFPTTQVESSSLLEDDDDNNNNNNNNNKLTTNAASYEQLGMEAIGRGQVAALVLAGGQGTRLGFAGPKGMYSIGSLPHINNSNKGNSKSLFQLLAERIRKLGQLAMASSNLTGSDMSTTPATSSFAAIPFYIMTSPLNHIETVAYFQRHDYFGLDADQVVFFQQGMLPCLTDNDNMNNINNKMILESAGSIAMAPDGNGGIYPALQSSNALDDMTRRGVQYLHVFSIDNALVKPADPCFIGYCIHRQADCGNKVVWKAHAHEPVGVIATKAGKPCIVEYSEISPEMAEQTDEGTGQLVYGAANICNHFYTVSFIRDKILPNMKGFYHIAQKKIPYYDPKTKTTITPTSNNGIKLETFIFDVFPLSERMAVMAVPRAEEFAPVKNASGPNSTDSPDTARRMMSARAKMWVRNAGGILTGHVDDDDECAICDIAPLTSYAGEGLEPIVKGKVIECPFDF